MMTKLIVFLFRLLSDDAKTKVVHLLMAEVFPGRKIYKARPSGFTRPRDTYQTPKE